MVVAADPPTPNILPIDADVDSSNNVMASWRESSGRADGKDGYKFGDLTRTLVKKLIVGGGGEEISKIPSRVARTVKRYGWRPDLPDHRDLKADFSHIFSAGPRVPRKRVFFLLPSRLVGAKDDVARPPRVGRRSRTRSTSGPGAPTSTTRASSAAARRTRSRRPSSTTSARR